MTGPFTAAFVRSSVFGTLAAVHLPEGMGAVSSEVLDALSAEERAIAAGLSGRRQIEFAGGRIAWRLAGGRGSLLNDARGQPIGGAASVSVTHKNDLALVLVGDAAAGTVGIDLEGGGREPLNIAPKVLRADELDELHALPSEARWGRLVRCFALKEATYKAIHPHLRRYVSFHEARVRVVPPSVELFLADTAGPALGLEAVVEELGPRVLAMVRARRRSSAGG